MAAVTPVPASVSPVRVIDHEAGQLTADTDAGTPVIFDGTNGTLTAADAAAAGTSRATGITYESGKAGETVSFLRIGILDLGLDVLTALDFGDQVFLADGGGLADAAGTATKVIGTVEPGRASRPFDKLLRVNL